MENKKVATLTLIGILTLAMLTFGATYAYFRFDSNNEFDTPAAIKASTGALGSGVSIKKADNADLTLDISAIEMLQQGSDVSYYASGSSTPKTIATITADGAGTFNCTYTIEITKSAKPEENDLYVKFQNMLYKSEGQIYFTVNEETYDFNTPNLFDIDGIATYNGVANGITLSNSVDVTANLVIVNSSTINQTDINDSNITLSFTAADFDCTLVDDEDTSLNDLELTT